MLFFCARREEREVSGMHPFVSHIFIGPLCADSLYMHFSRNSSPVKTGGKVFILFFELDKLLTVGMGESVLASSTGANSLLVKYRDILMVTEGNFKCTFFPLFPLVLNPLGQA